MNASFVFGVEARALSILGKAFNSTRKRSLQPPPLCLICYSMCKCTFEMGHMCVLVENTGHPQMSSICCEKESPIGLADWAVSPRESAVSAFPGLRIPASPNLLHGFWDQARSVCLQGSRYLINWASLFSLYFLFLFCCYFLRQSLTVAQAGLKPLIVLLQPLACWDDGEC